MHLQEQERVMPALFELDARFRAMDRAGDGYVQIVNTANPPVENVAGPAEALELSRSGRCRRTAARPAPSGARRRPC